MVSVRNVARAVSELITLVADGCFQATGFPPDLGVPAALAEKIQFRVSSEQDRDYLVQKTLNGLQIEHGVTSGRNATQRATACLRHWSNLHQDMFDHTDPDVHLHRLRLQSIQGLLDFH